MRTALSPSRASDFLNCPLLYRFRTIDRLPEPPDPVAVRGTLVHAVLEKADPEALDLRAELLARVEEERRWWAVPGTSEEIADALVPMQHTPLGPLAGAARQRDVSGSRGVRPRGAPRTARRGR